MAGYAIFVFVVGLFYLSAYRTSFGFARPLEEKDSNMREKGVNDLSPEMKKDIRKLLIEAVNKIDESDVLRALKRSLYFRMRMCFSPRRFPGKWFQSPEGNDAIQPDAKIDPVIYYKIMPVQKADNLGVSEIRRAFNEGDNSTSNLEESVNEDGLSPEQKREVRMIMEEALKSIDDEEILKALKRSLLLRLKLCLRAGIRPSRIPGPSPTAVSKPSKSPTGTQTALKPENPSTGRPTTAKPNDTKSSENPGYFDTPELDSFLSRDLSDSEKQVVDSASLATRKGDAFETKPQQDAEFDPEMGTESTMEAVNERRLSSLLMKQKETS